MALIAHADTTYEGAIWTYVEPCIGLVCACLPIIRGLFPVYSVKKRSTYELKKSFATGRRRTQEQELEFGRDYESLEEDFKFRIHHDWLA
ncbi:MAG: hypothetical protein LQ340_001561 [Diploschistes diacapsis]|nr:MAG: hypothetical protein LQ340_001561 [Diploschistes diacapsis]